MRRFFWAGAVLLLTPAIGLAGSFDRDLFLGMKNDLEVTSLQEFLRDQGLYQGPTNGNFFALTRDAVKKMQEREKIVPVSGYFGPRTRARANAFLAPAYPSESRAQEILRVRNEIEALQTRLKSLQEKLVQERVLAASSSPAAVSSVPDVSPPAFTKNPQVAQAGFIEYSPFGAHYPYRVTFDWATDASGVGDESVACNPLLKVGAGAGRATAYFPEPHINYACKVTVSNTSGKSVSASVLFASPSWVSVNGSSTLPFPDIEATPLKIGEFRVYNGTASDSLFTNFETLVIESMDSTPNRNRKVLFLLRDGIAPTDPLISKTDFTFIATAAPLGNPWRSPLSMAFNVALAAGEEKRVSMWVEQLQFVKSGTLEIAATKAVMTGQLTPVGLFDLTLTKPPSL